MSSSTGSPFFAGSRYYTVGNNAQLKCKFPSILENYRYFTEIKGDLTINFCLHKQLRLIFVNGQDEANDDSIRFDCTAFSECFLVSLNPNLNLKYQDLNCIRVVI